jgi:hypothetical protein
MKSFNTVQELWDHCSFCPICQEDCRDVLISVGPDAVFQILDSEKDDSFLDMSCTFTNKKNVYSVQYKINCQDNTFTVDVTDVQLLTAAAQLPNKKVEEAYFYFYLQSSCPKCQCAVTYGSDLELDILDRKITNIELEREGFYLLKEIDKFHITTIYDRNIILVSRCQGIEDGDLGFEEDDKTITLPMVKLDFTNQAKIVNKIKTLILFS